MTDTAPPAVSTAPGPLARAGIAVGRLAEIPRAATSEHILATGLAGIIDSNVAALAEQRLQTMVLHLQTLRAAPALNDAGKAQANELERRIVEGLGL